MRSWKGYGIAGFVTHSFNDHEAATVGQTWAQPWVKDESGVFPVFEKRLMGTILWQRQLRCGKIIHQL